MPLSIAHLGPAGTYAEQAAFNYGYWLTKHQGLPPPQLIPEPSITQTIFALDQNKVDLAVVPVENSIEGGVSFTLDTLWQLEGVSIREAFILAIDHMFVAHCSDLTEIEAVYSHPQPLGQCQQWLAKYLPQAQLIPTPSTSEGLRHLQGTHNVGAIASERAATLNDLPIQCRSIQDHPDNCTKFWVLKKAQDCSLNPMVESEAACVSLAFSLPQNIPGALLTPLKIFAHRHINLSRIESRPAKTSLGDYVFFVDAMIGANDSRFDSALQELKDCTEVLKVFGSYPLISIPDDL